MRYSNPSIAAVAAVAFLAATSCAASPPQHTMAGEARSVPAVAGRTGSAGASRLVEQSRYAIPATPVRGVPVAELSGLAWDNDEQLLYAVSDQGNVFHFRLTLDGTAIRAAEPVYAAALADAQAGPPGRRFNAEGLTVLNASNGRKGDTELVVSLEGSDRPEIVRFRPAGGKLGDVAVPPPADDRTNYRKKGQGLESVAHHPTHGLMTAPESPLSSQPETHHALYAANAHWSFARFAPDSRLKALDIREDGTVLALERSQPGSGQSMTTSLRAIQLSDCSGERACEAGSLIVMPAGPNNFEGMALLGDGRVLIVSDHGGAKDPQATTLVLLARR